jgi:hypothetical protein
MAVLSDRDAHLACDAFELLIFSVMSCPPETVYIQPMCQLAHLNDFVIDMLLHTRFEKVPFLLMIFA